MEQPYKILFSDIGGVLLTNGWGHKSRETAAEKFGIDYGEMDALHDFIFNVYEMGKISLDVYLDTIFLIIPGISREKRLKILCLHNLWNYLICFPGLLNGKIKISGSKSFQLIMKRRNYMSTELKNITSIVSLMHLYHPVKSG